MKGLCDKILINIRKGMQLGALSNNDLVEIIKLSGEYLNLKTIPDYCKENNISYQGAKKDTNTRVNITIFNTKFIIDND